MHVFDFSEILGPLPPDITELISRIRKINALGRVLMDWTSMYFGVPANGTMAGFGHTRDHRPDRPKVVVDMSVNAESGMPVRLTVMPNNILDVTTSRRHSGSCCRRTP